LAETGLSSGCANDKEMLMRAGILAATTAALARQSAILNEMLV
jgi:hypothetical protein